jgi:hypothetical protein
MLLPPGQPQVEEHPRTGSVKYIQSHIAVVGIAIVDRKLYDLDLYGPITVECSHVLAYNRQRPCMLFYFATGHRHQIEDQKAVEMWRIDGVLYVQFLSTILRMGGLAGGIIEN